MVKGYHNREYDRKKIDSFAFAFKKKRTDVTYLSVSFLEYSEITNPQNLKKNPRDFYRYSYEDALMSYNWENGIFMGKHYSDR
jgi:hypothetical protein